MARVIREYVIPHPEIHGVYHVSSDPISKYDLLNLVKSAYHKTDVDILPDQEFVSDRSLDSTRFRQATGYLPPSWPEMVETMASSASFYQSIRGNI